MSEPGLAWVPAATLGPMQPGSPAASTEAALNQLVRQEWGRMVAALARTTGGDLVLAEDALQVALMAAARQWPHEGVPDKPVGWLLRTARFKAIDQLRRRSTWQRKQAVLQAEGEPAVAPVDLDAPAVRDDQLRLLFTCCHPELSLEARVALTLKTVAGLSTEELACAFLVDRRALQQRIVRTKRRIQAQGIPYEVPTAEALPGRLAAVLQVVYLVFTEGYAASSGAGLLRADLSGEALRLGAELARLLPEETEVHGLNALMCFQHARRAARTDATGELVLLEDQDRLAWDHGHIAAGMRALGEALRHGPPGPYTLQAAIASVHCRAPTWEQTDWGEIRALYAMLGQAWDSPVVRLNEAVAVAMSEGIEAGLARIEALGSDKRLARSHLYASARADLLRRLGRLEEARRWYGIALARVGNAVERRYLERRLAEVGGSPQEPGAP